MEPSARELALVHRGSSRPLGGEINAVPTAILIGHSDIAVNTYDAFVSYSRADEKLVKPVVQFLSVGGRRVFWDSTNIEPGERWSNSIMEAVRNSSTIVVLWCCHSARSAWVAHEAAAATAGSKPVVPVLLCSFPLQPPLSEYQWIDYRSSVTHQCAVHGTEEPPPAQGVRIARLLDLGVGLESFDPSDAQRAWGEALVARRFKPKDGGVHDAIRFDVATNLVLITGFLLIILAMIRPFPSNVREVATTAINLITGFSGLVFVVVAGLRWRRKRQLRLAKYPSQLLGLTIESIVAVFERGQLGEVLAEGRRLTRG